VEAFQLIENYETKLRFISPKIVQNKATVVIIFLYKSKKKCLTRLGFLGVGASFLEKLLKVHLAVQNPFGG